MTHIALLLLFLASIAHAEDFPPTDFPSATGQWLICVGESAGSLATSESCSVALGDNVQFPPHADHVLATIEGVRPLPYLDEATVARINQETMKMLGHAHPLDPDYVREWNKACSGNGQPVS